MMKDQYNRSINYARISLSDACNLNCLYCKPKEEEIYEDHLNLKQFKMIIKTLSQLDFTKVRFTGGEPLLNKDLVSLVNYAHKEVHIKDIGITTNGIYLDKYLDALIKAGLTRINISLDTLSRKKYKTITKSNDLNKVILNIKLARSKGLIVKINTVLIKSINEDEISKIIEFAHEINVIPRFIELMPIGLNKEYYNDNFYSANDIIKKLNAVPIAIENNEVSSYYLTKDGKRFGIITPLSNHFCDTCNRIRITSNGQLRMCLHSDDQLSLVPYLNSEDDLKTFLLANIIAKPKQHQLHDDVLAITNMAKIGG